MDNGASSYRRFLDGDESAFDEAIDTFSDLVVNRRRYNFKVTLKTYVFMLGRSRALNYIKHRKKLTFEELSEAENISDDREILEESVLADELKFTVNDALRELPEDMHTAVHLVYFEGLTYEEAAKIMKRSRKQVDNLLYRAKKELRNIIGKDGEELL